MPINYDPAVFEEGLEVVENLVVVDDPGFEDVVVARVEGMFFNVGFGDLD